MYLYLDILKLSIYPKISACGEVKQSQQRNIDCWDKCELGVKHCEIPLATTLL